MRENLLKAVIEDIIIVSPSTDEPREPITWDDLIDEEREIDWDKE